MTGLVQRRRRLALTEIVDEGEDVFFASGPRAHEARVTDPCEFVVMPAFGSHRRVHLLWETCENSVGLSWEEQVDAWDIGKLFAQNLGVRIGASGNFDPGIVPEKSAPASGEESHLGGELARLLASIIKLFGQVSIKENHGFTYADA